MTKPTLALTLLTLVSFANYVDRMVLSALAQPIKLEFSLTDTQLGLLTGFAFVLLYSLTGVPMSRLADRSNRARVLAAALTLWSLATAACGLARSYAGLLLARLFVGIGESGCQPIGYGLLGDYFPPSGVRLRCGLLHGGQQSGHHRRVRDRRLGWLPVRLARGVPGRGPARSTARAGTRHAAARAGGIPARARARARPARVGEAGTQRSALPLAARRQRDLQLPYLWTHQLATGVLPAQPGAAAAHGRYLDRHCHRLRHGLRHVAGGRTCRPAAAPLRQRPAVVLLRGDTWQPALPGPWC